MQNTLNISRNQLSELKTIWQILSLGNPLQNSLNTFDMQKMATGGRLSVAKDNLKIIRLKLIVRIENDLADIVTIEVICYQNSLNIFDLAKKHGRQGARLITDHIFVLR